METELASLMSRASVVLDHILATFIGVLAGIPLTLLSNGMAFDLVSKLVLLGSVGVFNLAYFVYFEGRNGDTPVKAFLGLKVVKTDGSSVGYRDSLIRNILRPVDVSTFYLTGVGFVLASPLGQRLGDMSAGTMVVSTGDGPEINTESLKRDITRQMRTIGYVLAVLGLLPTLGSLVAWIIRVF